MTNNLLDSRDGNSSLFTAEEGTRGLFERHLVKTNFAKNMTTRAYSPGVGQRSRILFLWNFTIDRLGGLTRCFLG